MEVWLMKVKEEYVSVHLIDVYEQMLFERAMSGIRPMLYISSTKDLEYSVLMLLEERGERTLPPTTRWFVGTESVPELTN
jgi:hypothetical protein